MLGSVALRVALKAVNHSFVSKVKVLYAVLQQKIIATQTKKGKYRFGN